MKLIKENCQTCTKLHALIMLKKAGLENKQPSHLVPQSRPCGHQSCGLSHRNSIIVLGKLVRINLMARQVRSPVMIHTSELPYSGTSATEGPRKLSAANTANTVFHY